MQPTADASSKGCGSWKEASCACQRTSYVSIRQHTLLVLMSSQTSSKGTGSRNTASCACEHAETLRWSKSGKYQKKKIPASTQRRWDVESQGNTQALATRFPLRMQRQIRRG